MNDEQRKEIRQQFWDEDYFDGLPNKGELLKHFINEYGKAIERQQQAEIEKLRSWVEMLVEVPFFNAIDHYRGIPVSILRKAQEK
jgi:hypothetical protein